VTVPLGSTERIVPPRRWEDVAVSETPLSGQVAPGFEEVRATFADVLAHQPGTGAAVAVWHDQR